MFFLLPLVPEPWSWVHEVADPVLMLVLAYPALYFAVLRPLHHHIRERQRAEEDLRRHREHLEETVAHRTAELQASNQQLQQTIAEHQRAESALRASEEALREAKDLLEVRVRERTAELHRSMDLVQTERRRFKDVLDQLPAYLILLSPDYHVSLANRFFEERFGQSQGRRCYEYLFHRTEPCENCETFKVLQTRAPHHWYWTGPDGRDYDIYDFPFTDADGSPLIMEVGLDITERKQAEAELAKHREHLEDLVQQRTAQLEAANAQLHGEIGERKQAEAEVRRRAEELRVSNEELGRFNRVMVGRELRMIELKKQVNELCAQLGQPRRYPLEFTKEQSK
ncbi:MAG: PAS domain-containing protein [Verrucomicrobia bacterium]|nr:PAS domain-containing protein [Verrucomicrobiota bacterium]